MTTATKVRTRLNKRVLNQIISDLRAIKPSQEMTERSPHGGLFAIVKDGKTTWQYNVFGVIADRLATTWTLQRESELYPGVFYYYPNLDVAGKNPYSFMADFGFTTLTALRNLTCAEAADYLSQNAEAILNRVKQS